MRTSLRLRFGLPYILLLLAVIAGLSLFFINLSQDTYKSSLEEQLFRDAQLVASQAVPSFEQPMDYTGLDELAQRFSPLLGARITLIKTDGVVVGESDADANVMENHLTRPEVKAAVTGVQDSEIRFSPTLHKDLLYAAVPVWSGKAIIGVARLAVPLDRLDVIPAGIRRATLAAAVLAVLAGIALALLITNSTVRPLQRLSEAARTFSSGQLTQPHLPVSADEIGQLNAAFMRMAADLRSQFGALQAERSRLGAVLERMNDGVIIVDADGRVTLMNPAAEDLFQPAPQDLPGATLIEVVRHYQIADLLNKSRQSGGMQSATLEAPAEKLFLHVIAAPLGEDLPGSTLLLFQDLTRIRRLETVRQDFVSNVSHELRTPLAALKALAETLQEGALEDPPAARGFLERMNSEIDNMAQLVQELLELSRIESGRVPLQKAPLDAGEAVRAAVERIRLQAGRAGLTLQVETDENLPVVPADRERIEQVLVNILHNAVKFTPPGGTITASARASAGGVTMTIRDTGRGIPPADLERIFERFYKTDKARSGGGTGLGLSIARHIVDAHHGTIRAESQPGAGSAFHIFLPSK